MTSIKNHKRLDISSHDPPNRGFSPVEILLMVESIGQPLKGISPVRI